MFFRGFFECLEKRFVGCGCRYPVGRANTVCIARMGVTVRPYEIRLYDGATRAFGIKPEQNFEVSLQHLEGARKFQLQHRLEVLRLLVLEPVQVVQCGQRDVRREPPGDAFGIGKLHDETLRMSYGQQL
jgi:hypothetical protein